MGPDAVSLSTSQLLFLPWLLPPSSLPARPQGTVPVPSPLWELLLSGPSAFHPLFGVPESSLSSRYRSSILPSAGKPGLTDRWCELLCQPLWVRTFCSSGEALNRLGILCCASFPQTLQQQHQFVFSFSLRMMFFLLFDTIPFMSVLSLEIIWLLVRLL